MRVGIEFLQLTLGESGGIVPLLTGVLEQLFALAPEAHFIVYGTSQQRHLLRELPENAQWSELIGANLLLEMDRQLLSHRVDVLLRCYPLEQQLFFPAGKQIFLIPDVQHEAFPDLFEPETLARRRAAFNHAARDSGAIGVISEATRDAVVSLYPETHAKIFLMPPALTRNTETSAPPVTHEELGQIPTQPYFFFPANIWPHKNHHRLIASLKCFNQTSQQKYALVLTGHPEGWEELKADIGEEPVFHLGFVRRPLLREVYRRATALTYFSLYEGFGMPLLEAFDVQLPVLCSNTSSLPEVGGDAVLTCDPTDHQAIADLMHQISQNDRLRQRMIGKGMEQLCLYSWSHSAENLLNALTKLHEQFSTQSFLPWSRPARVMCVWWCDAVGKNERKLVQHYSNR